MDADRNLLCGVLALQADLIDSQQFIEICTLWATRKDTSIADLLIERGWLRPADRIHLDYLVQRKVERHGGNVRASLAAVGDDVKRSLVTLCQTGIHDSLDDLPAAMPSLIAETVDHVPGTPERYDLHLLHATGGIGRVWMARDRHLGRDVALKELRPEQAGNAIARARFFKEAQITGQLEHPGIVPLYELGRRPDSREWFYTMRFVRGRTLSEAARSYQQRRAAGQADSLELLTLLNAFVTVANTVAYAHARGVLHRDLKGGNIVLGDFGEVVVLDWGLAKLAGESDAAVQPPAVTPGLEESAVEDLTVQGQALGTPAYMAPEQAAGRLDLLDCRTDVYGLGAVLYEILTGQPPFTGSNKRDIMRQVRENDPQPPRMLWPEVPPALEAICLKALDKQPEQRHASATELAQAVQQWQEVQRRRAEEALRHSEALYRSLVESLPVAVWRKDFEGRFTFINRQFFQIMGRRPEEILGKTDFDLSPPELAERYRRDDLRVHQTGKTVETTEEFVSSLGVQHQIQVIKIPICDAGGTVMGTQGIAWDVSERKRLEAALARTEALLAQAQARQVEPGKSV